ncbi:FecR family protein [Cyclobacterium jeungdonense]|uniref:FecR domain-containing protein n=1 Tax=Cyclobacterium jeungdonense TaxID=708087 RepID=A0ABT8CBE7_9BACT|nr:FecR family protein [Cyclobacterium jeungdonense]MDN3689840.1 FecR domain-containing protein [Cyclobacterium jeungdonense]
MNKRAFLHLLQKKDTGRLTSREKALLLQVLDQLQRRELTWDLEKEEAEEIKQSVKRKIDDRIQVPERVSAFSFPLRLVASLVLILCLGFLVYKVQLTPNEMVWEERVTNERQKATITLPDGSLVFLNTNTSLRFPKKFEGGKRVVELNGEAFFDVLRDSSSVFEVHSHGVRTKVLGTSFNVKAHRESAVKVAVKQGKVGVYQQGVEEEDFVELQPNQMATVYPDSLGIQVEKVEPDAYLAWKAQSVSFDLDTFDEIIPRLAAIYNYSIEIEGEGMDGCLIKATYSNGNLYAVLHGLKNLADFEIQQTGERKLTLYFKRCIQ